jgi:hypothetical protein
VVTPIDRRPGLLFTPATAPFPLPRPTGVPGGGQVRVGPAGRHATEIEAGFAGAWRDCAWPARPWHLLVHADEQGVDLLTRAALLDLPARAYASPAEVAAALAALPPTHARRGP